MKLRGRLFRIDFIKEMEPNEWAKHLDGTFDTIIGLLVFWVPGWIGCRQTYTRGLFYSTNRHTFLGSTKDFWKSV